MRKIVQMNENWHFTKENQGVPACLQGEAVRLPHTWNAVDGQDGKNDYYRGTCWYTRELSVPHSPDEEVWLEFRGAAMTAEVYLNEKKLARHEGGYSTFRVNLTEHLEEKNILAVSVDNGRNRIVYPQKADFTFYGGIYRDVYLLTVPKWHFELAYCGTPAIKVTPVVSDDLKSAAVTVETWQNCDGNVTITAAGETHVVPSVKGHAVAAFYIDNVHLWDGRNDPYLYTAEATLESGDKVSTHFGCRSFRIDPEQGFILNGRPYRLCGAARHQDRQSLGNALTTKEHEEDISLLLEMGANTVRLAHYQHDQYFYDLCDQAGLIAWAEIPYITEHMPEGRVNTLSQMEELIVQCCNHPSIVCWGLSNEISATGGVNPDMVENHNLLNDLCHRLDKTRPTTMAHVFMLDTDDPFVRLPDIRSYNLYYGWYVGEKEENDVWFDEFHAKYPDVVMGLSEYGADANPAYQSAKPQKGDWSESYQAVYHEHMLKMWSERPYIWAMHCWNMFDFGADGRDEGGKPGQNQKGLVTFDRKLRKDAFYIYKAYLSKEPFVHLCGSRYVDRHEDTTEIKVYSNQSTVTLYMDGVEVGTVEADKVFKWSVKITGEHTFTAKSGEFFDTMTIRKVSQPNMSYYKNPEAVVNWFDKEEISRPEGYFSIYDTMGEVQANPAAAAVLAPIQEKAVAAYGDVAKNIQLPESMLKAMARMTVEAQLKQMGSLVTPEVLLEINNKLNRIKKGELIMASAQMEGLKAVMQQMMARGLAAKFDGDIDPERLRSVIQVAQANMPTEPGVTFVPCELGGVEAELSVPENARADAIIIYVHGGGLICGNAQTSRGYASMLAGETKIPVYSFSYRLAPENKFPAAIEDSFAVYRAVLNKHPGLSVFLIGESGGAYLSITTTLLARDRGIAMPAGVIPYSPPLDFSGMLDRNHPKNKDFTVSPNGLESLGKMYFTDESQYTDPIGTPYYADFHGFAPTYLVWDESESLAVDAEYLRDKLIAAGVEVIAESYPDCFHAFPTSGRGTPESAQVLANTVSFINEHI